MSHSRWPSRIMTVSRCPMASRTRRPRRNGRPGRCTIFGGADLTAETMQFPNEFTDRQTGRFSCWLHRRGGDT